MGAFSRSWDLTKTTLNVMRKDMEIFLFPILAVLTSIIFIILLGVSFILFGIISFVSGINMAAIGWLFLFLFYLLLAVISTFFSVCVVYITSIRLNGKNATFSQSIKFAFSRFGKIFSWAIVSATVGLILKVLENLAQKAKGIAKILFSIFNWIIGALWAIATIFVVQGIVYKNLGPFSSIKDSVLTLKKTWGESLIKYIGFGMVQFVLGFVGLIIALPLFIIGILSGSIVLILSILFLLITYFVALTIFFNIADDVYNTALYYYANTGKTPEGFTNEQMKERFKPVKDN